MGRGARRRSRLSSTDLRLSRRRSQWAELPGEICFALIALLGQRSETPRVETHIPAPENGRFDFTSENGPMALSRDGKRLALIATFAGKNMIWVRSLGSDAAQPIVGTEGAHYPFWSPDGR